MWMMIILFTINMNVASVVVPTKYLTYQDCVTASRWVEMGKDRYVAGLYCIPSYPAEIPEAMNPK